MQNNHTNFHNELYCLNCGLPLIGKFCSDCGQKANLHKDSFWHMVVHFIGDYFHYDGKFWKTILTMVLAPGLVTLAFINGKRVKYLNPISLYIFISTLFFLFISYDMNKDLKDTETKTTNEDVQTADSIAKTQSIKPKQTDTILALKEAKLKISYSEKDDMNFGIGKWTPKQKTYNEYKIAKLKDTVQDGWFKKRTIQQYYKVNNLKKNGGHLGELYGHAVQKNFPKAFFLLLPFYALLLSIFYRKQKLFYVDHAIHSVHIHIALFIITGLHFLISNIINNNNVQMVFSLFCIISFIVYLFISLKKVYQNSGLKTALKLIAMGTLYTFGFIITMLILLIISFFMI